MSQKVLVVALLLICGAPMLCQESDTILSTDKNPPEGYTYAGALFEGTGYWSTAYVSDHPLSDFQAVQYKNILYFPGGQNKQGNMVDTTASYDPLIQEFNSSALPPMPTPRSRYAAAIINSTIYITGGQLQKNPETDEIPDACMISFDLENPTGSWESEYACMSFNRSDHCMVNVQNVLYAIGGYNEFYEQLSTIERYDPGTNEWAVIGEMDRGRGDLSCVAVNEKIYILGGIHANFDWSIEIEDWFLSEFISYDSNLNITKHLANMTHVRGDFGFVGLPNDRLLVMGGETHHKGERTQVAQHFVEEYIISQDIWIQKAPMDNPRFRFGAAYVDNAVYVYGGHQTCDTDKCAPTTLADIEVYVDVQHPAIFMHQAEFENGSQDDGAVEAVNGGSTDVVLSSESRLQGFSNVGSIRTGSGYWSRITDMPTKLSDFKVVQVDSKLLIIGGLDDKNQVLDSVIVYDPILRTYNSFNTRMPEPRMRFAAALTEDKLYVIGGYNTSDYDLQDIYGPATQPLILDLQTGKWSYGNELKTPRSDLCAAVVNQTVFVAGGWPAGFSETLSSVEYMDESGAWQELTDLPTPRGDCQAVALQDEIIVLGGYYDPTGSWSGDSFRTEVEAFNTLTNSWTTLAPLPNARGDKSAVKLDENRILVMGGETHARGESTELGTRFVEEYLREQDAWVQKADLPEGKFRAGAAVVDGGVYLFGGHGVCPGAEVDCVETAMSSAYVFYDVGGAEVFIHTKN